MQRWASLPLFHIDMHFIRYDNRKTSSSTLSYFLGDTMKKSPKLTLKKITLKDMDDATLNTVAAATTVRCLSQFKTCLGPTCGDMC